MPTYTMRNTKTEETKDMFLSLSEREAFLAENPDWVQSLSNASFVSQIGSNLSKTDGGWKDHLKKIKHGSGRSNTIKL